jgi:DMSO reductase family type II enzyme chaperone
VTQETAAGRAYGLLAAAFRHPHPDLHASLRDGTFVARLDELCAPRGAGLGESLRLLARAAQLVPDSFEIFEASYIQAFDLADARKGCSPYAASYMPGPPADVLIDLKCRYSSFDLRIGPEERPDHVAVELEFLSFLARREGAAPQAAGCRSAEEGFVASHFANWIPAFTERLARRPGMEFHAAAARLADAFARSRLLAPGA